MTIQTNNLIPIAGLAKEFGYSRDHLAYLCRQGELEARQEGRYWKSTRTAVMDYRERTRVKQQRLWDELAYKQSLDQEKKQLLREQLRKRRVSAFWDLSLPGVLGFLEIVGRQTKEVIIFPLNLSFDFLNWALRISMKAGRLPDLFFQFLAIFPAHYDYATNPVNDLYKRYGEEQSYYQTIKKTRLIKASYTTGLFFLIGFTFTHATTNFFDISAYQLGGRIEALADPPIELVLGQLQEGTELFLSQVVPTKFLADFRRGWKGPKETQNLAAGSAVNSSLVNDYLEVGLGMRTETAYFPAIDDLREQNLQSDVAGARVIIETNQGMNLNFSAP